MIDTSASGETTNANIGNAIRRTMRLSVLEGAVVQVFLNWTSGSVLIGYMLALGASADQLALVSSVPLLAQVASPLAAVLGEALGRRRVLTVVIATLGRALWLLAALLPSLPMPAELRPVLLLLLVLVASLFLAANSTLWTAWMGDVVPTEGRGRFFGTRAGIVGLVGMLANLAAGWFLDRVAAPLNFQVVVGASLVFAVLGVVLYLFHYDPPTPRHPTPLREVLLVPLRSRNFRHFLVFAMYWQFVVMLASPFTIPYFLEELHMTFTQVAMWSVIAAVTAMLTTVLWGRAADRAGNKAVLAVGTFLAGTLLPASWIAAGLTGNLTWIWFAAAFDALAWGAIGPAIFNLALVSAPREGRVAFIAMYSLASGVLGFLGGVLAAPLLTMFSHLGFSVFGIEWTGYHWLFVLTGVGRSQAWRLVRRVEEAESWRTRDLLRHVRPGWRLMGFPWR